ncbi:nitric oxide synthase-like protein isoform X1 [Plodia interpunctella]|uniref:nitric oxide synthase-like protein isoform X1 n=1 Tax=Plodia interpunctella TaxID=58824 RepID=UPI002367A522|nr:nitric oxide synthase-like protein isoform X1 [Plodia interpunctella]
MAPVVQTSQSLIADSLEVLVNHNTEFINKVLIEEPMNTCPIDHLNYTVNKVTPENGAEKSTVNGNGVMVLKKPPKRVIRPKFLKNYESKEYLYDRLYDDTCPRVPTPCSEKACLGSVMAIPGRGDVPRDPEEVLKDAKDFLGQYFASIRRANTPAHEARWLAVQEEVERTGTYQLTTTELVFGAKLAWRNASRCIGRIQWSKLQVFDCRQVTTTSGMFEALCNHMKYSTNKGNIRSAITVFPQRTDGQHDYRIWNSQLISYAGYRQPDGTVLGDPMHCEFTELCIKLGWKPPRTAWDILPLVLSANGKDPDYFEIPRELVMEIHMTHPTYEWFSELDLRWYALPAVSNMRFDCGGIEFTANAFNGWYMSTEIGCRNFCDTNRLNMLEKVAQKMGLDTRTPVNLWRDKALVEVNVAVLHSFQQQNATIVDHHTASESFIKHLDNENRLRSGCPADWIWIVPPMSSSITPVFHQEMALYYLRPSYEYQEPAWKTHQWQKSKPITGKKPINRKFHFKQIARAVKFTSKLFGRALSKRIKATVLYATETGKSEQFAKELGVIFGHAFNAQVHCMVDYDITSIEHEALLLVVTSTFGNGDPPENGVAFAEHLCEILYTEQVGDEVSVNSQTLTPKSFIKANSQIEFQRYASGNQKKLSRLESLKGSATDATSIDSFGPLSNVRFAVFALGSSAYPNFCNFGKYVDKLLGDLGGERIHDIATGDEMCGQDQAFRKWASSVFNVACETFCLDDDETLQEAKRALGTVALSEETVRFSEALGKPPTLPQALQSALNKKLVTCIVRANKDLGDDSAERSTIFIDMDPKEEIKYDPGDHVGIIACNRKELVDGILARVKDVDDFDQPLQLQLMKETHTSSGPVKSWEPHERLPIVGVRDLFTRFLDITTPPTTILLQYLAKTCDDEEERKQLNLLSTDPGAYEDWRHYHFPTLTEVLDQFPSAKPSASLLAALLSPLQPRFYSISSSPIAHPKRLHLTVAVVTYRTQDGEGPVHYGVCSNYLMDRKPGDEVYLFIRSAPNFHLPQDISVPLILIGPGTGIAPFRGFWHHRRTLLNSRTRPNAGPVWLFFGCRTRTMDLYREEKEQALKEGVLSKVFLALSREKNIPKMYVQELAEKEGSEIHDLLINRGAHFYVCGDCKMAEDVHQKLKGIVKKHGNMSDEQVQNFMFMLKEENRYHEDIFGITLRTAEVHSASRESARRNRVASQP